MRVCVCSTLNNHTIELHLFHVIPISHTRNFPDEYRKYAIKYYTLTHSRANAISENIPAIT